MLNFRVNNNCFYICNEQNQKNTPFVHFYLANLIKLQN